MPGARIKFDGREIELGDEIVTCGRAGDNTVAFTGDANVSRYHAEIEHRSDGYWITDLSSINGTTVNGESLHGDRPLNDGDRIVLGGTSELEFYLATATSETAETSNPATASVPNVSASVPSGEVPSADVPAVDTPTTGGIETEAAAASSGSKTLLVIAAIICGVAVICVGGSALALFLGSGSKCNAKAVITKPEAGDTIANPVDVEVEAEGTGCVAKAIFTLDGEEIASADSEPYTTTIDPSRFPELADGLDHSLQVVLLDENGAQIGQPQPVQLAFETRAVDKPTPTPEIVKTGTPQQPGGTKTSPATLLDVQQMSGELVKQFRGGFVYNISNKQFLQEVQKRANEYAVEGFFDRAAAYRDVINTAYVKGRDLDAPLGFILAMSRSKFIPNKQGDNEGLWQMSNAFVTTNAYNGLCGTETLSDPSQDCAAKASALYMKAVVNAFDNDPIYSVAAFGKSPQDVAAWKASLPADRTDVWNTIKGPQEREQLIRFFAAGIVARNPGRFGLKKDRPLDELYRVTQ